jgi:hypothetical protein
MGLNFAFKLTGCGDETLYIGYLWLATCDSVTHGGGNKGKSCCMKEVIASDYTQQAS